MTRRLQVLYLVPDLIGPPGGIALASRTVDRTLARCGFGHLVFALNDSHGPDSSVCDRYAGCKGNRLSFLIRAVRALRWRPSVILLGHPNFSFAGWILARLSGAQLVIFLYGVDAWEPLPWLRRFGLRRANGWIAISACTADRAAAANHIPRERIEVLHLCLTQTPKYIARPESAVISILTVGRIAAAEGYKGHDRVIRAMPALLRSFPDLVYHIAGDGDGRPSLEALARREGVAEAVRFHGAVSDEDLDRLYGEASIFVMPSAREGFGFVFLEAMAHGLPIVAGNADATPEVVAHGETGLLVNPDSLGEIVEAAKTLLADPDLRRRMGRAGRQRVEREFSYEAFSHRLLTILGSSLAERVTGR